jgi:hypothetical protein
VARLESWERGCAAIADRAVDLEAIRVIYRLGCLAFSWQISNLPTLAGWHDIRSSASADRACEFMIYVAGILAAAPGLDFRHLGRGARSRLSEARSPPEARRTDPVMAGRVRRPRRSRLATLAAGAGQQRSPR